MFCVSENLHLCIYENNGMSLLVLGFPDGLDDKDSACNAGDPSSIPGLGRFPGEGNGYPIQYSCLDNSMDRRAWKATVHGGCKCKTWLHYWIPLNILVLFWSLKSVHENIYISSKNFTANNYLIDVFSQMIHKPYLHYENWFIKFLFSCYQVRVCSALSNSKLKTFG